MHAAGVGIAVDGGGGADHADGAGAGFRHGGPRAGMITPQQLATEVADAAALPTLPLRIPIGDAARALLRARRAAPDDVVFDPTKAIP